MTKSKITNIFDFIAWLHPHMMFLNFSDDRTYYIMTSEKFAQIQNMYIDYKTWTKLAFDFIHILELGILNTSHTLQKTVNSINYAFRSDIEHMKETKIDDVMAGNFTNIVKESILIHIKQYESDLILCHPNNILKFLKDNNMKLK